MKQFLFCLVILLWQSHVFGAVGSTFLDYQNYNHGYCPECNCYPCRCSHPCDPCANTCVPPNPCNPAPVCGTNCGISACTLGAVIAGVAIAAAFIIGSNNGSAHSH